MTSRISSQAAAAILVFFAALSWVVAFVEWVLTGRVELVSMATALMFTAMLVAWPFLSRTQASGKDARAPCRQCGNPPRAVPFTTYCLRCGAYPKQLPILPLRKEATKKPEPTPRRV